MRRRRVVTRIPGLLLVIGLAAPVPRGVAASMFEAQFLSFDAGSHPDCVSIGDLNGDGKPDLAVAVEWSDVVSVLLGNGDGSFGAKTDYGVGGRPVSVAIGDVNGDGSFGAKTDFGAGGHPTSLAMGDLNGDGKLDVVTANWGSNTVSVLLGNGNGTFAVKTDHATGDEPNWVAIADLNGDEKLDLAVANFNSHTLSVLLGTGNGGFGAKVDHGTGASGRRPTMAWARAGPSASRSAT